MSAVCGEGLVLCWEVGNSLFYYCYYPYSK